MDVAFWMGGSDLSDLRQSIYSDIFIVERRNLDPYFYVVAKSKTNSTPNEASLSSVS